ncbi:hypothetical protein [Anaeromyxobacter oryzae]|uniref:Glycerophosphoryl diester phosphodiesterase membrane domain-containing protein n=1 Tax=Anaeromyxobacter oryzae TaxID=2918170 RepID=A0ABM7WYL6_9BACT|nr:hypothetical protein [Anaeromyxobacter oryzae]BDG04578.1 hypothetical protein AMOR_35740 [Anaeromyxobacter oryzae]
MSQPDEQPLPTTLVRPSPYEAPLPAAAYAAAAGFTAGEVIGKTLKAWWKNVVPFTILSVVTMAPVVVWLVDFQRSLLAAQADPASFYRDGFGRFLGGFGVVWVVSMLLYVVALGAMTRGTFGYLRGERVSFGAMLTTGFGRGLPVVALALVAWIAIMFASILLVFPGIMLACAWAASVPAAVVERIGPFQALSRSAELTRGVRWKVFAAFLALFGVLWGLSMGVQLAASAFAVLALPAEHAPMGTLVVSQLGTALFSCIPSVGCAVTYHELRAAREGLDTAQLASVFE